MAVVNAIEVANFLGEGYDAHNKRGAEQWSPLYRAVTLRLAGQSSAIQIANGGGKSSLADACLFLLSKNTELKKRIASKLAPSDQGWSHVRIEFGIKSDDDITQMQLITASPDEFPGTTYVVGMCGNRDEQDWHFYIYQGFLADAPTHVRDGNGITLVPNDAFRKSVMDIPAAKWNKWGRIKDWHEEIGEFTSIDVVKQNVQFQLKGAGDAAAMFHQIRKEPEESFDAAFFRQLIAPELLSEAMGEEAEEGEKGLEDTLLLSLQSASSTLIEIGERQHELELAKEAIDKFEPVLEKARETVAENLAYENALQQIIESGTLIHALWVEAPFPGVPVETKSDRYGAAMCFILVDKRGALFIEDEGVSILTGIDAAEVNQKARDLKIEALESDPQMLRLTPDVVGGEADGRRRYRRCYPANAVRTLVSELLPAAKTSSGDFDRVLTGALRLAASEVDTNCYRIEANRMSLSLASQQERHRKALEDKRSLESRINRLREEQREIGEDQIVYESFAKRTDLFPPDLLKSPHFAREWSQTELDKAQGVVKEHHRLVGERTSTYELWKKLKERHGLLSLTQAKDQLDQRKTELDESYQAAKSALDHAQSEQSAQTGKRQAFEEKLDSKASKLRELEALQSYRPLFEQIFGATDPEELDPRGDRKRAEQQQKAVAKELSELEKRADRFDLLASQVAEFCSLFGDADPQTLDPVADLANNQRELQREEALASDHKSLVAELDAFRNQFPNTNPGDWLEETDRQRLSLSQEKAKNTETQRECKRELDDLDKYAAADARIYADALAYLETNGLSFERLHSFISRCDINATRRSEILTLFSWALSAPVLESVEQAEHAAELLEKHKLLVPVFLSRPLQDFVKSGSVSVRNNVAFTFVVGRKTRQVEVLLDPALVRGEKKRIEAEISRLESRNLEIDAQIDRIRLDGDLVKRAAAARRALEQNSELMLANLKDRIAALSIELADLQTKASRAALASISAMTSYLRLGGDDAYREVKDALPNVRSQLIALEERISDLDTKITEEATVALVNAKKFKQAGGRSTLERLHAEVQEMKLELEALKKAEMQRQQQIDFNLKPSFDQAQTNRENFMSRFRTDRSQLDQAIEFEANHFHLFMERADERSNNLEIALQMAQERLRFDFTRAQRFVDRSEGETLDYAALLVETEGNLQLAINTLDDSEKQITVLTIRSEALTRSAEDLHDVALAIKEQYVKVASLSPDLRAHFRTSESEASSELLIEIDDLRRRFDADVVEPDPRFSGRLRRLAQEIRNIPIDTRGLRSALKAKENAVNEFRAKRDEFCERARNGEIKGLHNLEIDRIAAATTLEELHDIQHLKTAIEHRIEEEVKQLEDKRAVMVSRKEAGIDTMVSFARRAEMNLKTLNDVMARTPQARFFIETSVADEVRVREVVEWLIAEIEDRERALRQRTRGVTLNESIAKRNSSYGELIRSSLTKRLFIDPNVYFAHAGIWNGKKSLIIDDKLSMGQKTALHLMWMIKQAEFNLGRAIRSFSTTKERRLAAQRAQRVIIFDGLFSNLSDENLINDAFEGLKYVGGNFQLVGFMHNPRYINNPEIFPTYLVGQRFRNPENARDRGFIAIESWQEGGKMAIFSSYYKRRNDTTKSVAAHV